MKRISIAAVLAGVVVAGMPVASAAPATVDCSMDAFAQGTVTGGADTYTGSASGYVAGDAGSVSIRCEVRVNGGTVSVTPTGTGTGTASTSGQVTFTAADEDDVDLCAVWTSSNESGEVCVDTTTTQVPPQEVLDLVDSLGQSTPNSVMCGLLAALHGWWGDDVWIGPDGDVWVDGGRVVDCPPYGNPGPGPGSGPPRIIHG